MAARRGNEVESEIDALFRISLAEFTAARNALAARLRKAGRPLEAARVKALAKPSAPAWAVNQLFWENPKAFDQLFAAAERVRKAQTGVTKNADLGALLDEKKRITAALIDRAAAILGAGRHAASSDLVRRVSATLESLAVRGQAEGSPGAGRLTSDLDPPGFEALAAFMGGKETRSTKVLLFRAPKAAEDSATVRARAREAVQSAEKALREARRAAERADAALTKANAQTAAVEHQKREIEARHAEALNEARAATQAAKKAAQAVVDAERSLARARAELE